MNKVLALGIILFSTTAKASIGWLALSWQPGVNDQWVTQLFRFDTSALTLEAVGGKISCVDMVLNVHKKTGLGLCSSLGTIELRALAYDEQNGIDYIGASFPIAADSNLSISGLDQEAPRIIFKQRNTPLHGFASPRLGATGEILSIQRTPLGPEWIGDTWFYIDRSNIHWREGQIPVGDKQIVRVYQLWQSLPTGEMALLRELRETTVSPGASQDQGSWPAVTGQPSTWLSDTNVTTVSRVAQRWIPNSSYQPYQVSFTFERGNWITGSKPVSVDALRLAEASGVAHRRKPDWISANPGSLLLDGQQAVGMRLDSYTNPSQLIIYNQTDSKPIFIFKLPIAAARGRPLLLPKLNRISD